MQVNQPQTDPRMIAQIVGGCSHTSSARATLYSYYPTVSALRNFANHIGIHIPLAVEKYSIARDIVIRSLRG